MDVVVASVKHPPGESMARQLPPAGQVSLVWHPECPPRTVDQYRRVAHALRHRAIERSAKVVAVTSALPQEGKTLSTVNLAVSLSESYRQRVLVVDADLRIPSVMKLFGVDTPADNLADWLVRETNTPWPMVQISETLAVVPAAPSEHDPVTLLTLPGLRSMLSSAREQFDWVLVDTPPVGLLCDARVLDEYLDGFLVVVGSGRARYTLVKEAIASVGETRVLGLLLNRAADGDAEGEKYATYYRASLSAPKRRM
jgi:capsular exopolysaccharide synthesis family protein